MRFERREGPEIPVVGMIRKIGGRDYRYGATGETVRARYEREGDPTKREALLRTYGAKDAAALPERQHFDWVPVDTE